MALADVAGIISERDHGGRIPELLDEETENGRCARVIIRSQKVGERDVQIGYEYYGANSIFQKRGAYTKLMMRLQAEAFTRQLKEAKENMEMQGLKSVRDSGKGKAHERVKEIKDTGKGQEIYFEDGRLTEEPESYL